MSTQRDPKLDEKFYGILVKSKNNAVVPPAEWFVLLAKDNAVPATLDFYREQLVKLGAGDAQLAGIDEVILKVRAWRARHPELCKVPDVEPEELP